MFLHVFHFFLVIQLTASEFKELHTKQHPTWSTYYSVNPKDCSKEELLRKFPHIYRTDSHSNFTIGPPENFTVTLIEREALKRGGEKNRHYPGAVISFYPPENDEKHVTGYEIRLYKNKGYVCIVMDITQSTAPLQDKVELELFPLFGLTHYQLTAWSLPPYSEEQRTNTTDLVTGVYGLYKTETTPTPPSANWHASVAYHVIDDVISNETVRSVEMVMSSPPPEYNFQLFEIVLVPTDGVSDIRKARTSKLYQVFENITVGNYKVMMWPVDEYFSQTDRCLCKQADGTCSNCLTTVLDIVIE
ncbi:uncharacterized protein LOC132714328 [Ruditapes philippinarum]|uniref:uncharacterized protein LOC132714328 n=1 Tax=Ruditapes philippinarum TaxID=129788 RepID=UPI00295B79FF|nr:uncharacterized protein LOC132714328 [Ruditapes philippinarum]